jgi:hypothetical protein
VTSVRRIDGSVQCCLCQFKRKKLEHSRQRAQLAVVARAGWTMVEEERKRGWGRSTADEFVVLSFVSQPSCSAGAEPTRDARHSESRPSEPVSASEPNQNIVGVLLSQLSVPRENKNGRPGEQTRSFYFHAIHSIPVRATTPIGCSTAPATLNRSMCRLRSHRVRTSSALWD